MRPLGNSKKNIFLASMMILAILLLELMLRLGGVLYFQFQYPAKSVKQGMNDITILCLGDSFTQGFGAPTGMSYPEQLQELMKKRTRRNVVVYKEFRINSSTILKYLEKDISKYSPNLIIVMTGCNDLWNMENARDSVFGEDNLLGKIDIALSGSRVYKLMKISFLNVKAFATQNETKSARGENIIKQFRTAEAQRHYILGEQHFYAGAVELALNEYLITEGLEPQNPWVHWRKACIYVQAMHDTSLAENELRLTVQYGDSRVLTHAYMLLFQLYVSSEAKILAMIKEMEAIIDARYSSKERVKAKEILRRLSLLRNNQKTLEKVVAYNLSEIIKIAREKYIKVVLMKYPDGVAHPVGEVVERVGGFLGVPVVDNQSIFAEKLKTLRREYLFASDGHCNAQGYGLIAENLQEILTRERMG